MPTVHLGGRGCPAAVLGNHGAGISASRPRPGVEATKVPDPPATITTTFDSAVRSTDSVAGGVGRVRSADDMGGRTDTARTAVIASPPAPTPRPDGQGEAGGGQL